MVVRNDLTNPQKAVQGTHAAIEVSQHTKLEEHPSVIYVVVKNEKKLKSVDKKLLDVGINIKIFREPDVDYEMTAIATEPLIGEKRNILRKYMLLQ